MQQNPVARSSGRRRLILGALALAAASIVGACQGDQPASRGAPQRPQALPPAEAPAAPLSRVDVDFGHTVRLEGVSIEQDVVRPGDYLRVWLHWEALAPVQEDLRSLGQVVAPTGRVVGKEDDQIGPRKNYLSRWRHGDRHTDEMRIRISPSAPPGEYALVMAVLRPDNQTHVPITARGEQLYYGEDSVLVGTIEVDPAW